MAESKTFNVIELEEEEVEGDQNCTKNYRFSKIGEAVPINSDQFDTETLPSRPLEVSDRFGALFVAHSSGFCVARTKDVIKSAEELKNGGKGLCIQELSVVDVHIGKVSILALSADSSTLTASIGGDIRFFSVAGLLNKESEPSFSCSLNDSSCVKDMRWTTKFEDHYVVLSSNGKLYFGAGQDSLKYVMDNVDAVEWSVKGKFVAVARNNILSILSSRFREKLRIMLSFKSWVGDSDANCVIKVDSIRWVRPDCIILGCYQLTDDGKEENYLVQVITCKDGKITNASSNPVVLCFSDVFQGLNDDAVPFGSGPHMVLSYLDECKLAFIANRKNMDQHIVLCGWSLNEKNEAEMIEILNDAWCPTIHCQGNGDDNSVLGIAVDKVSHNEKVKLMLGETEDQEVSPCCILLCLTVDGKVSMFHFASAAGPSVLPEASDEEEEEEEDHHPAGSSGHGVLKFSIGDSQQRMGEALLSLQSQEVKVKELNGKGENEIPIRKGYEEVKYIPDSQLFKGSAREVPVVKADHDRDDRQPLSSQKQGGSSEGTMLKASQPVGPRAVVRDFSKLETQELSDVKSSADSFSILSTDKFNRTLLGAPPPKDFGVRIELPVQIGSTSSHSSSSGSLSTGALISSKTSDVKSSPFTFNGVQGNRSDASASTARFPVGPLQNSSFSRKTSGPSTSANLLGQVVSTGTGITNSTPVVHSGQFTMQKSSDKGHKRTQSPSGQLNSEPNLSEQFCSVEEMTKELDAFLESIEGPGGFYDASVTLQKTSVTELEEGMWALSDRCRIWMGIMDERLEEIQLLRDKMVQVLARKQYMEGIVKQAADSKYWDLWNRQKLSSELEMKQRRIVEINQNLTNQLIELERHLNALELKRFGESGNVQMNHRSFQSKHGPSRYVQSLHSLRNTMSSQLAAAEQLSECLSKQMAILSIEMEPVKKQSIRKELFEAIGISYDGASFIPPESGDFTSNRKLLISSASAAAKVQSRRDQSSAVKSSEPETARRRRDSLDRNWTSFDPPKTTVKRILLQEDHQVSPVRLSLSNGKQQLNDRLVEGSAVSRNIQARISSPFLYPSEKRGSQDISTKQSSEDPSSSSFQLANYHTDLPKSLRSSALSFGYDFQSAPIISQNTAKDASSLTAERSINCSTFTGKSDSIAFIDLNSSKQSESYLDRPSSIPTSLPAQTQSSPKKSIEFSDSGDKEILVSNSTIRNGNQMPIITESSSSFQSRKSLETPSFSMFGANSEATSLFGKGLQLEAPSIKGQLSEVVSSSSTPSLSVPVTSLAPPSFIFKDTAPTSTSAMSLSRLSTSSEVKMDANQTISLSGSGSGSSVSSFLSLPSTTASKEAIASSVTPPVKIDLNTPKSDMPEFKPKTVDNSAPQVVSEPKFDSSPDKNSTLQASPLQPDLTSGTSSLKFEPSIPISEPPASSLSGSQVSFSATESPALVASNSKPEQPPFAAPVLSSAAVANSDDAFTQEDEMEEEAPETTQLTFGSLGGFGLGSAPNPAAPKPHPFGASFGGTSTNPPITPFTMTPPSGGLFRPASFNIQSPQLSQPSQQTNFGAFSGGFGSGTSDQTTSGKGFGQPAPIGSGQQALGSVLGAFGQSRQLGAGLPGSATSPSPFASGFASNQPNSGFSAAPTSGGFASLASAGGGFGSVATVGGGFAAAATGVGGFSGAASGSGFSAGGFGAFGNQGGSGGFSAFGNSGGTARPPYELLTQMRK